MAKTEKALARHCLQELLSMASRPDPSKRWRTATTLIVDEVLIAAFSCACSEREKHVWHARLANRLFS
jgi:hypothetical protein